ncbi:MAG: hypothetical protein IPK82_10410 [Polyangiaceae bacterium]|nr:hypothetical protein [Polyangiaceae bacterium]
MNSPLFYRLLAASTLTLLTLFLPSTAAAQPTPSASPSVAPSAPSADTTRGMASYAKGAELATQQKWAEAYPHLKDAWDHLQHWRIALALGKVELELGKYYDAEKHLTFARGHIDLPESLQPKADKMLAEAKKHLFSLEIVATSPIRARLLVDGEAIGWTPYSNTIHHQAGEHRVELRIGRVRKAVSTVIKQGQKTSVKLTLTVNEVPDVPIEQDDPSTSSSNSTDTSAQQNSDVSPDAQHQPSHLYRNLAIAAGGLAAVALGTGIGCWAWSDHAASFWSMRKTEFNQYYGATSSYCKTDNNDPLCREIQHLLAVQDLYQTLAVVSWVASGVFATGAITLGAVDLRAKEKAQSAFSWTVTPTVSQTQLGVVVQGAF